ncbi:hypothetical protein FHG66_20765 [Rubellimicrobium rubrum]|uniref:Uncharacterized protein n=1 Tax=Rubellimicrobium rubrum TaxID=2585369 RepID=A0A5C4MLE2_9RHOB|nr:DUF6522 family protein [Rubellimicrobium rubrum]TNC44168.1 hypothetical protein FHG66_20765 [Rubellimicrobium rubrum]
MRLEPTPEGGFVIDAQDLGPLLGVDAAQVPDLMREGHLTRRFERGEGEDLGRFRLTFRYGTVTVRLVLTADGTVIEQSRILGAVPS